MNTNGIVCWRAIPLILVLLSGPAFSASPLPELKLKLEHNLFYPFRMEVPAYIKFKLIITNLDTTPEQFDSFDLNREKVIFPQRQAVIYVGPLKPGKYEFFGEYNPNTARGIFIATDAPTGDPDAD